MYLKTLDFTLSISNLQCLNCFSLNGGFIMINSANEYFPHIIINNLTL